MSALIKVTDLLKEFKARNTMVEALNIQILEIEEGEAVAIEGVSGSGKTTFLHLMAGFYKPTFGKIFFDGENIFDKRDIDRWRGRNVGYIFQNMNLLPEMTALENVVIAANIAGISTVAAESEARRIFSMLGLSDRMNNFPWEMSIGEQQRVAVARAIIHKPRLILADEPTASLDAANAAIVIDLLKQLSDKSILMVATHDENVKRKFARVLSLDRSRTKEISR